MDWNSEINENELEHKAFGMLEYTFRYIPVGIYLLFHYNIIITT